MSKRPLSTIWLCLLVVNVIGQALIGGRLEWAWLGSFYQGVALIVVWICRKCGLMSEE